MIELVAFDLGGVIVRHRPDLRLGHLAELSGKEPQVLQREIFDSGFDARAEAGELTSDETLAQVRAILGNNVSVDALIEAWAQAFAIEPDVLAAVRELSCRKVIFTNNGPMLDLCLPGPLSEIASAMDEVVCSWHVKARKPTPEAFERAATHFGVRPDSILFLDDSSANVSAAQEQGWQAHLVSGPGSVRPILVSYGLLPA